MRKLCVSVSLLMLLVLAVPFAAAVDSPQDVESSVQAVTVEAPEGEADLTVIAACVMFCGGCACGLLTGSEVSKLWLL